MIVPSDPSIGCTPALPPRLTRLRVTTTSTVGDRIFPVATARVWNGLPVNVTLAPLLQSFRGVCK